MKQQLLKQHIMSIAKAFRNMDIPDIIKQLRIFGYQLKETYPDQFSYEIGNKIIQLFQIKPKDYDRLNLQLVNAIGEEIIHYCEDKQYGDILNSYKTGWYVFVILAEELLVSSTSILNDNAQIKNTIKNDLIRVLSIVRNLDMECKTYQAHLLKRLNLVTIPKNCGLGYSYKGNTLWTDETGNLKPAGIEVLKISNQNKGTSELELIAQKYNKVQTLREKLHDPDRPIFERIKNFKDEYNKSETRRIITVQRDSAGMKFLLAIAVILTGVIPSVIALAVNSKFSSKNSWKFWKSHGASMLENVNQHLSCFK